MAEAAWMGVDVGTSSTKGVVVDAEGRVLRAAQREHDVDRPRPGHVEMDPDVWWSEFQAIAAELTAPRDVSIEAVGVSGMGPCVLLADEDDVPVRPAVLYGVDTRATDQIARLEEALGGDQVHERCGSQLSSQAAGPKILWVREAEPESYRRARRLFMPASWLVRRLTGAYVLDRHSASQCTPMYDAAAGEWYRPWAERVAPGLELPPLAWAGEVAGTTHEAVAGIHAGTPVVTGTIDAWAEAISVDAHNPGDLMLMYGTTMFLVHTVLEPLRSPSLWTTAGALPGTQSLAGGMATSGAIAAWLRHLTGGADHGTLVAEAAQSGLGARGLLMLPYFAGERTPVMDPHARGLLAGLTLDHTRGDLYRAALEATAFGVRHNVETIRAAGGQVERVVAVGGGTRGGLWTQIVSDVTGLPQVVPRTTTGAAYGMAHLAARSQGVGDIAAWNPPAEVRAPDLSAAARYDELYQMYRDLYPATRDISHRLARLQLTAP
ncbi:sugar kinase [Actinotalea sp. BY-33]|uniref:Sugar kinase n=1 Tax=Actinotalea soli TaxID=2819234 RepID=A0A939LU19_9CELL|nr:FGGY family carbohydrate kinase [Actinotalea soli]MBO1752134.1 sugar kinase [Actinotalea soli]